MKRNKIDLGAIILIVAATAIAMLIAFFMIRQYRLMKNGAAAVTENMVYILHPTVFSLTDSFNSSTG